MLYLISVVLFAVVVTAGMYVIRRTPHQAERVLGRLCFVGLILQLFVNYLFWGAWASALNPLAYVISAERSTVNLMFLALISIFCYAALLVSLYKTNDFYNNAD